MDSTLSDQISTYATTPRRMAVVVGISAFSLLELVRRELLVKNRLHGRRSRDLSGAEQGCGCNGMPGRMLGANVEYYQIDNLKLTTLALVEWSGETHGGVTKPRPTADAFLSAQRSEVNE